MGKKGGGERCACGSECARMHARACVCLRACVREGSAWQADEEAGKRVQGAGGSPRGRSGLKKNKDERQMDRHNTDGWERSSGGETNEMQEEEEEEEEEEGNR